MPVGCGFCSVCFLRPAEHRGGGQALCSSIGIGGRGFNVEAHGPSPGKIAAPRTLVGGFLLTLVLAMVPNEAGRSQGRGAPASALIEGAERRRGAVCCRIVAALPMAPSAKASVGKIAADIQYGQWAMPDSLQTEDLR